MSYTRKTHDEWEIQGLYEGKWDTETYATTRKEAEENLREYRENCLGVNFRIVRHRVPNTKKEEETI